MNQQIMKPHHHYNKTLKPKTLSDKKQLKESKRDNDRFRLENDKLKEKMNGGAAEVTPDLEAGLRTTTTSAPRSSQKYKRTGINS